MIRRILNLYNVYSWISNIMMGRDNSVKNSSAVYIAFCHVAEYTLYLSKE